MYTAVNPHAVVGRLEFYHQRHESVSALVHQNLSGSPWHCTPIVSSFLKGNCKDANVNGDNCLLNVMAATPSTNNTWSDSQHLVGLCDPEHEPNQSASSMTCLNFTERNGMSSLMSAFDIFFGWFKATISLTARLWNDIQISKVDSMVHDVTDRWRPFPSQQHCQTCSYCSSATSWLTHLSIGKTQVVVAVLFFYDGKCEL